MIEAFGGNLRTGCPEAASRFVVCLALYSQAKLQVSCRRT